MPVIRPEDYPPNNGTKIVKGEEPTEKRVRRVVNSKVLKRRETWLDKISRTFLNEDSNTIGDYIIFDVIIPQVKDTLLEVIKGGLEMLFWGGSRPNKNRRDGYTSYGNFYRDNDRRVRDRGNDRPDREEHLGRNRHRFDDIVIPTRAEAEEVLDVLLDIINEYETVSVADFFDAVGQSTVFTDSNYGWDNLSSAKIRRVRRGYVLDLPRPSAIT